MIVYTKYKDLQRKIWITLSNVSMVKIGQITLHWKKLMVVLLTMQFDGQKIMTWVLIPVKTISTSNTKEMVLSFCIDQTHHNNDLPNIIFDGASIKEVYWWGHRTIIP